MAEAAQQRASADVETLRAALDRANAQKRQALAELERLSREHAELQRTLSTQGSPPSRGPFEAREEGFLTRQLRRVR